MVVIVQARMQSTRLPGKVALPLAGEPLLARMIERVRAAQAPFDVVVATTTDPSDDPIVGMTKAIDVRCFRGHPTDLLDRHHRVARAMRADAIVKIPSDCPLIDPAVIDRVIGAWRDCPGCFDYMSNLHPPTYPDGNDVEVFTMDALETAWREATMPHEREHTTPFVWDRPERFRIGNVTWETGLDLSMTHRLTIDYREDYRLIAAVYDALWTAARPIFSLAEIIGLLERRPEIRALNTAYLGVNWYRHHLRDLRTVTASDTRSPELSS